MRMTEIIVAAIGLIGVVAVALISNRGRQHAKATREQVQNSHQTNLRHELDERHREHAGLLAHIVRQVDRMADWQENHQAESDAALKRLEDLEDTFPKGTPS